MKFKLFAAAVLATSMLAGTASAKQFFRIGTGGTAGTYYPAGITMLATAFFKYFLVKMNRWEQALCIAAALLMVAPSLTATLIGVAMVVPVLLRQFKDWRAAPVLS